MNGGVKIRVYEKEPSQESVWAHHQMGLINSNDDTKYKKTFKDVLKELDEMTIKEMERMKRMSENE